MEKRKSPGADDDSVLAAPQSPADGKPFPTPGKNTEVTNPPEDDPAKRRSYPVPTDQSSAARGARDYLFMKPQRCVQQAGQSGAGLCRGKRG